MFEVHVDVVQYVMVHTSNFYIYGQLMIVVAFDINNYRKCI